MTLMTMNYDKYQESLEKAPAPISPNSPIFNVKKEKTKLRSM